MGSIYLVLSNQNNKSQEFVSSGPGCFIDKESIKDHLYLIFLKERTLIDESGKRIVLEAVLCVKTDSKTEHYLRRIL
jgi:hypothetical protein